MFFVTNSCPSTVQPVAADRFPHGALLDKGIYIFCKSNKKRRLRVFLCGLRDGKTVSEDWGRRHNKVLRVFKVLKDFNDLKEIGLRYAQPDFATLKRRFAGGATLKTLRTLKTLSKISGTKPESPVPPNIACPQGISGRCAVCGRDAHRGRCGRRDVRRVPRAVCVQARPNPPV